jgi:excisionase family DNA binding protein
VKALADPSSPWLTRREAAQYAKRSPRFLTHQVRAGKLRAAIVGGRRELLFRREWLDAWIESLATPVFVGSRRSA